MAEDIASFAKESTLSHVRSLTPADFPDRVINSREPWFVDFFAPVCQMIVLSCDTQIAAFCIVSGVHRV